MPNDNNNIAFPSAADSQIVLYQPDESITLEVKLEGDTVWLTQAQMTELFQTSKQNISLHVNNIFKEGELNPEEVVKESLTTTPHGAMPGKLQQKKVKIYSLDVIISVGYRVKSRRGTQFRQWATKVLREYLLQGYAYHAQLAHVEQRLDNRINQHDVQLMDLSDKVEFLVNIHQSDDKRLFPTGCVFDAWQYVSSLVRSAKQHITLIDNYCDERTLIILSKRTEGVTCTIHTRYSEAFVADLEKHNRQYPPIQKVQLPHKEHDRFLIIDQTVYILGDSLKDLGHSMTTVLKTTFTPDDVLSRLN